VLLQALTPGKTTNDTCAQMLRAMVPGSLGPAKSMRDDLQNRDVEIIGSELSRMESHFFSVLESHEEIIRKMTTQTSIIQNLHEPKSVYHALEEVEHELTKKLQDVEFSLDQFTQRQQPADQTVFQAQTELDDATRRFDLFQELFREHYVPLKDVKLSAASRKTHIMALGNVEGGTWIDGAEQDVVTTQAQLDDTKRKLDSFVDVFEKSFVPLRDEQGLSASDRHGYIMNLCSLEGGDWIYGLEKEVVKAQQQVDDTKHTLNEFSDVFNAHFVPLTKKSNLSASSRHGHIIHLCSVNGGEWIGGSEQEVVKAQQQLDDTRCKLNTFVDVFDSHFVPLRDNQTLSESGRLDHIIHLRSLEGMEWPPSLEEEVTRLQHKFDAAHQVLQTFSDAFQNWFVELQNNEALSTAHRKAYLQKLLPFLSDCDECVIGSFDPAALHSPSQRGPWCKEVYQEVCRYMKVKRQELEGSVKQLKHDLEEAKRKLKDALENFLAKRRKDLEKQVQALTTVLTELQTKHKTALEQFMTKRLEEIKRQAKASETRFEELLVKLKEKLKAFLTSRLEHLKKQVHDQESQLKKLTLKLRVDLEKLMSERRRALQESAQTLTPLLKDAMQVLQAIKDDIVKFRSRETELRGKLGHVRKLKRRYASASQEKVASIQQNIQTMQMETRAVTNLIETFRSGALQAFHWLKDHSTQDFSTSAEEAHMQYCDEHVKDKVMILDGALKHLRDRSPQRRELLFCSAPSCLCPAPKERRDSQASQCLVIGEALQAQETLLTQAVRMQFDLVVKKSGSQLRPSSLTVLLDAGIDDTKKPKNGLKLASKLLSEKESDMQNATQKHANTLQVLTDAEAELKEVKQDYERIVTLLTLAKDIFSTHWVPLKGHAIMKEIETEQHLHPLMDFLASEFKIDECLLGGLRPAARERPAHRGDWCKEVMAEAEQQIQTKLSQLQAEMHAKMLLVAGCEAKVATATRDVDIAMKAKEIAEEVRDMVKTLMAYVQELSDFRLTVLSVFRWLHTRGQVEQLTAATEPLVLIDTSQFTQIVETISVEIQEFQQQWKVELKCVLDSAHV